MEIIDNYLDEVCGCIKNTAYRRAVRRELQNHIEDNMECAGNVDRREAAELAVAEMGDAREMGSRLNSHFPVRPDIRLILYILGISFLYTIADVAVNGATGFSMTEMLVTLFAYGISVFLFFSLKSIDLEGNYRLIKYLYFGTLLLLAVIGFLADLEVRKESMTLCGNILLLCVVFFVYRLHRDNTPGFVGAVCLFLLPIPFFLFSTAYAALLLYFVAGVYMFAGFLLDGWRISDYVKALVPLLLAGVFGITAISSFTAIFMKRNLWGHFFLRYGLYDSFRSVQDFRDYPLAACINRYGYWTLAVYGILVLLILGELIHMKRKGNHLLGHHIMNCIILFFLIKSTLAVLLNLGVPFIRSYMLPFAGFSMDQAANLLWVVVAEYVYCFGDFVFGDYSFFEENKLFEVGNGRITFITNNQKGGIT